MATIYDVARAANVSPKTVSRVLNSDSPVGAKTRKAVEEAMSSLGYVPSRAARMMRSNRSGLVGIITGAISAAPVAEATGLPDLFIVQGIQRVLDETGLTVMIADTANRSDRVGPLVQRFSQHRVEGLIYVADYHREVSLPAMAIDAPVVLVNCFDSAGTPCVLPDDRRGQAALVERLIAAGHRRIGYIGLRTDMVATRLRIEGYRAALHAAGIAYDDRLVSHWDRSNGIEELDHVRLAAERMLELPEPPTAICCGNDKLALALFGILRMRGVRIPEQVSVAGYDDYRIIAETLRPPLTTVDLPYHAMGEAAARRLVALISGEGRERTGPDMMSGPVVWRRSVTDLA